MGVTANNQLKINRYPDLVGKDKVVRLEFRVSDAASGHLLQYGDDLIYLHGGYGGAFPKVEQALDGCTIGDRRSSTLSPEEGYGDRDPNLVLVLASEEFQQQSINTGAVVEGELANGESIMFTVADITDDNVTLDGNHPFAGKSLNFEFEVLEIRDSTPSERAAGLPL